MHVLPRTRAVEISVVLILGEDMVLNYWRKHVQDLMEKNLPGFRRSGCRHKFILLWESGTGDFQKCARKDKAKVL